jgi:hypothetical protein
MGCRPHGLSGWPAGVGFGAKSIGSLSDDFARSKYSESTADFALTFE